MMPAPRWVMAVLLVGAAIGASAPRTPRKPKPAAAATENAPVPTVLASADAGTPVAGDDKADVGPVAQRAGRYFEGLARTPEEQARLDALADAIRRYEEEARDFRREINALVQKKYEQRKATLSSSYDKAVRDLEVLERKERLDAIAQLETFLSRYPDDARYTPDVTFRLGELYYERSSDDHALAMRDYEARIRRVDPQQGGELPPEPRVDFSQSIVLYQRLLEKFPNYRLNDAANYLLGYCYEKQENFTESRAAYQKLIAAYPRSRFATEAWVRLGEYYFDSTEPDALAHAVEAYEKAIQDRAHPLFDKALYKLGWAYYRLDRFDDAVDRFLSLIDFYATNAKRKGDGESEEGGDLRAEALQYTAISLVDEKWGGLDKAQAKFKAIGGRGYEAEVYRKMGDVYFEQTRHPEAIAAYRLVLAKDPMMKDAPMIQQRIVQAFERDRNLDEAFAESTRLATAYGPGSKWYDKWKRDPEVVAIAAELAERSLYSSAIYHHQQALAYKKDGKFDQAKLTFELAARAYGAYLKKFPRSKNAYEMEFYYAECLYNSFQFAEAGRRYSAVRDSPQDSRYLKEAAFSAVLSWQKQLEVDVKSGAIPDRKVLRSSERPEGETVQLQPLTDHETQLVAASDAFLARVAPGDEKAPGVSYKAAELFYVHNDFPEARRRFEAIIKAFPKSEVAKFATNLTIETFLVDKDWRSVEEVSAKLAANKELMDPKSDLYKELVKFKLAGRFKLADELMARSEFEEAAKKYIALVDEEPKHEFADKALNNAAVCFESTRRFDSALRLYERIFKEYPASKLADAALFRVAVNAENSYDFDKAVESYQRLVKDYPAAKDREAALFNTARLLEGLQRYGDAAAAYMRYADLFPNAEDAPRNQFRAALIFEKQGDHSRELSALKEFTEKFSGQSRQAELVIDAKRRMGDAHARLGHEAEARKAWKQSAEEFDRKRLKPVDAPVAAEAAAQARFQLAELKFKEFDRLKLGGSGKALANSFTAKRNALKGVQDAFGEVFKYKRLEWTLAALYRKGFALERFAQTIVDTPIPPEVKRLGEDAVVVYQDQLAQQTVVLEDKAVENYAATLAEARKNRISNEWTRRTLESLNRFRPSEYPVLKEARGRIGARDPLPEGLVARSASATGTPPEGASAPVPSAAPTPPSAGEKAEPADPAGQGPAGPAAAPSPPGGSGGVP